MNPSSYDEELDFARRFALDAGRQVLATVARGNRVHVKADDTPVTTADRLVNARFIDEVGARFPGDAVLGEEASRATGSSRVWVVDPVDGTQQLILAIPVFMVSIALVHEGRPVVAAAANPCTGEVYWALAGGGAHRDGTRLRVSARDGTAEPAVVCASGAVPTPGDLNADTLLRVGARPHRAAPVRFPWPTVFSGCKVAEGAWDGDLYSGRSPHDVAAVCLLVREAGGAVTDRRGADQRYDAPVDGCIASNGLVHDDLVQRWTATYLPRR
ncbi:inositol monophosphatase [Kineococcus glutinatus]|uniref:Inositol monophosphatase family protein n=1 Tax=Kineococcus glutinatus TaxID=1070872 RepID=A0ABP9I4K7_9ACTN